MAESTGPGASAATPQSALFLQGPMGPFFRQFADELIQHGIKVTKVNFNGGDALYFRGPEAIAFRDPMDEWPAFYRKLLDEREIDVIFLFGDRRPMHKQAIAIAKERGIQVWVFEEGYIRPNHITMEPGGVNGDSPLPKDPTFYLDKSVELGPPEKDEPVGNTFVPMAFHSAGYVLAMAAGELRYPNYEHHRPLRPLSQAAYWARSFVRKKLYERREEGILEMATTEWSGHYFLVPLQVHCDFQIEHSDYESIPAFIEEVVETFSRCAPSDTRLIIKHHPQDRAYRDYTELLRELGRRYGVSGRIHYIHDQHLPTLLKHARGCITMNSTVGTSALFHKTPVKVMGRAIYDIPGLTYQGSLANFFLEIGHVDANLYKAFNRWLREENQFNGSFYKKTGIKTVTALRRKIFGYSAGEEMSMAKAANDSEE